MALYSRRSGPFKRSDAAAASPVSAATLALAINEEEKATSPVFVPPAAASKPETMDTEADVKSEPGANTVVAEVMQKKQEYFKKIKEYRKAGILKPLDKSVKKRRVNRILEKCLKPKTAFSVFNELNLDSHVEVEMKQQLLGTQSVVARLTVNGKVYMGEGPNASTAKNVAADQAFKDLYVSLKNKMDFTGTDDEKKFSPLSAVCGYAMHLLFVRWNLDQNVDFKSGGIQLPSENNSVKDEEVDYNIAEPKMPPNPEAFSALYNLNLAFPDLRIIEKDNPKNPESRYTMSTKINGKVYEAISRAKKDAKRMLASKILDAFNIPYKKEAPATPPKPEAE